MYIWFSLYVRIYLRFVYIACIATNNKFRAENVCLVWKYIYMELLECEKYNILVLSYGADEDSHLLKAMRVTMSLMTDKSDPLLKHLPL